MAPLSSNDPQYADPVNIEIPPALRNYSDIPITRTVFNGAYPLYPLRTNDTSSTAVFSAADEPCTNCASEATALQTSGPPTKTIPDSPSSTETKLRPQSPDPNKNPMRKDIGPSFFYEGGKLKVQCAAPTVAYNLERGEHNFVNFPLEHWPNWKKEFVHKSRALEQIAAYQVSCKVCGCDEGGAIIPRDFDSSRKCKQWQADRCSVVFACYCMAELIQPTAIPGEASLQEYQDALNRIPQTVRNGNPNYFWRMHGLGGRPWDVIAWEPSDFDRMVRGPPRRVIDAPPGLYDAGWRRDEPFYLSGPEPTRSRRVYPNALGPGAWETKFKHSKLWKRAISEGTRPILCENDGSFGDNNQRMKTNFS
ncbi:hypothetical protein TWF281_011402 [Arthrobotrys megalospora]